MPTITVSGILLDAGRVLLVRAVEGEAWALPGGLLTEADDAVEDALVRALGEGLGVEVTGLDFLDTLYERRPDEVVVHNVFLVTSVARPLPDDRGDGRRWVGPEEIESAPLPAWLAGALPALLAGEGAPEPEVDLGALGLDTGLTPAAPVWIITGPAGAGKSTVARALCRRFPHAAHVEVDLLRWRMAVSGYVRPEAAGAGVRQGSLGY